MPMVDRRPRREGTCMRLTIRRSIDDIRNTQVAQPAGVYSNSISNEMGPQGAIPSDLGTSFMLVSCGLLGMEEGGPRWADFWGVGRRHCRAEPRTDSERSHGRGSDLELVTTEWGGPLFRSRFSTKIHRYYETILYCDDTLRGIRIH